MWGGYGPFNFWEIEAFGISETEWSGPLFTVQGTRSDRVYQPDGGPNPDPFWVDRVCLTFWTRTDPSIGSIKESVGRTHLYYGSGLIRMNWIVIWIWIRHGSRSDSDSPSLVWTGPNPDTVWIGFDLSPVRIEFDPGLVWTGSCMDWIRPRSCMDRVHSGSYLDGSDLGPVWIGSRSELNQTGLKIGSMHYLHMNRINDRYDPFRDRFRAIFYWFLSFFHWFRDEETLFSWIH